MLLLEIGPGGSNPRSASNRNPDKRPLETEPPGYHHVTHRMRTAMTDAASDEKRRFHLHLVSDATGETINRGARACLVQFEGIDPVEHTWTLIRTTGQMDKVLAAIAANPGTALSTM